MREAGTQVAVEEVAPVELGIAGRKEFAQGAGKAFARLPFRPERFPVEEGPHRLDALSDDQKSDVGKALLHQAAGLLLGGGQLAGDHHVQNANGPIGEVFSGQGGGGHVAHVAAAHK